MGDKKPVLEYSATSFGSGTRMLMYSDGRVEVIGVGFDYSRELVDEKGLKYFEDIDGKVLNDFRISPDQVRSYAERLVQKGFFEFKARYIDLCYDGVHESITLNYEGKLKTVVSQNRAGSTFNIISELEALVQR